MNNKAKIGVKISTIIFWIIVSLVLIKLYGIYKTYYYNGFLKAEYNVGISKFIRDYEVKYSNNPSYKITSEDFNDAMFYKEVKVKENTPYKITCMVKTENIIPQKTQSNSGALICIVNSTEETDGITGTNDWQKIEFSFNSKDRQTIKIGFRLGGNSDNCTGTVWFSDFSLEEGISSLDSNWNFACFIFKNLDVEINGKEEKLSMSLSDIDSMKVNMNRFQNSCEELSNNQMSVKYSIYEIDEPIKSISYSEDYGYYINPVDVKDLLKNYLVNNEYDHIFVCVRLGDLAKNIEIPINDWIGLGGMDLYQIGFSNIRLPNDSSNYVYKYHPSINTFPEEVFIHEFLHSLERTLKEYGYSIPALHDNELYGYKEQQLTGLKDWYRDYMQCKIFDSKTSNYIGLDPIVYKLKVPNNNNFKYSIEVEFNKEPQNIIEEIRTVLISIKDSFANIGNNYERNNNESIGI